MRQLLTILYVHELNFFLFYLLLFTLHFCQNLHLSAFSENKMNE